MGSLSFNKNNKNGKNNQNNRGLQTRPVKNYLPNHASQKRNKQNETQIISGYFAKEKTYKELAIARVNSFLCFVLGLLVCVCLVSYYFVTTGETKLNNLRKQTLAINLENEDLQHKLDYLQSYYNVDKTVAKTNILQRATKVMELSVADVPRVRFENHEKGSKNTWHMGY